MAQGTSPSAAVEIRRPGKLLEIAHNISKKPERDRRQLIIGFLKDAPNLHLEMVR